MTSTSMLKAQVRNIYAHVATADAVDQEIRERLADIKTLLLYRGYVTDRGPRGGVRFTYVGFVPDDAPAWQRVNEW